MTHLERIPNAIFVWIWLPQESLTSILLPPMDREFINNQISVIVWFNSNRSSVYEANFYHFFLKEINLFTVRHFEGPARWWLPDKFRRKSTKAPFWAKCPQKLITGDVYTNNNAPLWEICLNLESLLFVEAYLAEPTWINPRNSLTQWIISMT